MSESEFFDKRRERKDIEEKKLRASSSRVREDEERRK
jgi:hypothetical protein